MGTDFERFKHHSIGFMGRISQCWLNHVHAKWIYKIKMKGFFLNITRRNRCLFNMIQCFFFWLSFFIRLPVQQVKILNDGNRLFVFCVVIQRTTYSLNIFNVHAVCDSYCYTLKRYEPCISFNSIV